MKYIKHIASVGLILTAGSSVNASDLDIFASPEAGDKGVLTMVLDNSGSMGCSTISSEYGNLNWQDNCKNYTFTTTSGYSFTGPARYYYQNGYKLAESRMVVLKRAMIDALADKNTFEDDFAVGMVNFTYQSGDINASKIVQPALKLNTVTGTNKTHRDDLIQSVIDMTPSTNTPTALAYAEAAAYMMGTNTKVKDTINYDRREVGYRVYVGNSNFVYYKCDSFSENILNISGNRVLQCSEFGTTAYQSAAAAGIPTGFNYVRVHTDGQQRRFYAGLTGGSIQSSGVANYSGFYRTSDTRVRNDSNYISPVPEKKNECSGGAGIFFLTDGEPSKWGVARAKNLMNQSLSGASTVSCSSGLSMVGAAYGNESAWTCIGEYAKKLRDETQNPLKQSIRTAVVGFGSTFKSVKASTDPNDFTVDCTKSGATRDAKNACQWGDTEYDYGKGGAFVTSTSGGVIESLKAFKGSLGESVAKPISTATLSIPLDPLNAAKPRDIAYLPILSPNAGAGRTSLWEGNMKKYKLLEGTLVGSGDNPVFVSNTDAGFATNTKDLWNEASTPDEGEPIIGGVREKIFYKSATDTVAQSRNLFVENITASNKLSPLVINQATSEPSGFDGLPSDYDAPIKSYLANFLGFNAVIANDAADPVAIKDGDPVINRAGERIQFQKHGTQKDASSNYIDRDMKNHGAVLHSRPQLLTTKYDPTDPDSREDYILYGAFDGALRLVDDKTGKEVFSFLPKQVLQEQKGYLIPKQVSEDNKRTKDTSAENYDIEKYGVDGPWQIYATYKDKKVGTVNTKVLNQAIAFGGLRMGGSTYYALDLTDISQPKLLYSVGSQYGGTRGDHTKTAAAINGVSPAFARMGQSWAAPTVGYVKVNGQKTMVNFLPGGYDMRYEDPNFTANQARGNAIYMVKMGNVNNTSVDTSDAGKLLWWASSSVASDSTTDIQPTAVPTFNNSFVSSILPLDRDYDGLTDHLYFADLGGQVFRADINNQDPDNPDTSKVTNIVRVLDVSDQKGGADSSPRFYETPLVTFMRWPTTKKIVGVVSVGSGNRSKPLHKRNQNDRIYTFIDKDIAVNKDQDGYGIYADTYSFITKDIGFTDLMQAKPAEQSASETVRAAMLADTKQGWYYDLSNYLAETNVKGLKSVNGLNALNGYLYVAVFNPNIVPSTSGDSCESGVIGKTQREVLCLPYGGCFEGQEKEGGAFKTIVTRSEIAGDGIGENYFGLSSLGGNGDSDPCTGPDCGCTGDDCDPDPDPDPDSKKLQCNSDGSISLIKNGVEEKCNLSDDPACEPLKGAICNEKPLFPLSWRER